MKYQATQRHYCELFLLYIYISEFERTTLTLKSDISVRAVACAFILELTVYIYSNLPAFHYDFRLVPFTCWFLVVAYTVLDWKLAYAFDFIDLRASQHDIITGLAVAELALDCIRP